MKIMERKGGNKYSKEAEQIPRTEEINVFSFPNICIGKISRVLRMTCVVD